MGRSRAKKSIEILETADMLLKSVPYKVSVRWMFYQLLQRGYYSSKSDYKNKWIRLSADARKKGDMGWDWDTFADDNRRANIRGDGYLTAKDYFLAMSQSAIVQLDKWQKQDTYVEMWFEANAMHAQFKHATANHITLVPMGGQPSLDYKNTIATRLRERYERYEGKKQVKILYFGDHDTGGQDIYSIVSTEIPERAGIPIDVQYCGLTAEQAKKYNVPENFEKPGAYQWEALSDIGAIEIIKQAYEPIISHDAFYTIEQAEKKATKRLRALLRSA